MTNADYTLEGLLQDETFKNYAKGSNSVDIHYWESVLATHPELGPLVEEAKSLILSLRYETKLPKAEEELQVWNQVEQVIRSEKLTHSLRRKGQASYRWAAAIALFLLSAAVILNLSSLQQKGDSPQWMETFSPKGKRTQVVLADGSSVILNSESTLRYPKQFIGDTREVYLEGEAFFEVTRDTLHQFMVHSGKLTTTVLGTSFNVHAYPEDDCESVAVATGKVSISLQSLEDNQGGDSGEQVETLTLLPTELGIYEKNIGNTYKTYFEKDKLLAWKEEKLNFHDSNLEEIANQLERHFGVEIIIENRRNLEHKFNCVACSFENMSLEQVLEGWTFASELSYRIAHDTVFINSN